MIAQKQQEGIFWKWQCQYQVDIDFLWNLNPYIPLSHHILSSVDIFWYICLLWDWLLIWQSICPFLCLLIGPQPSVHCIGAPLIDNLGTTRCCCLSACRLLPYVSNPCLDQWPSMLWRTHDFCPSRPACRGVYTIAEFSSTIGGGWRGGTSHIQNGGYPARQMFVNTVWFTYDIRISHNSQISHSSHYPVFCYEYHNFFYIISYSRGIRHSPFHLNLSLRIIK